LWTTGNGRREEEPEPAENNDDGRPPEEMLSADDDDFLLAHGHLFSRAREFAHLDDAGDDDFDHDA
jgi:hypothetical protein